MPDPFLVILDIDNTQCRTSGQLVQPHVGLPYTFLLKRMVEEEGFPLIHSSGRSTPHLLRDMGSPQADMRIPYLSRTDTIITSVGTEILEWNKDRNAYEAVEDYIEPKNAAFFTSHYDAIKQSLADTPQLGLQSDEHLSRYKISAWGNADCDKAEAVAVLKQQLARKNIAEGDVTLTVSDQGKLAIDITPKGVVKGTAVLYTARRKGIPLSNVYLGGDSMNDFGMLSVSGAKVILPGNAQPELVAALKNHGGLEIYQAKASFAEGILEGLAYYGVIPRVPEIPYELSHFANWKPPASDSNLHKLSKA